MKIRNLIFLDIIIILATMLFILKEFNYLMIIIALAYTSPIRAIFVYIIYKNSYLNTLNRFFFTIYVLITILSLSIGASIISGSFKVINFI